MIVGRPTGIFRDILPQTPQDSASVIYTISRNEPPRVNLDFTQIPPGISERRSARTHSVQIRREILGALVYTTKIPGLVKLTSKSSTNEIGDILEFDVVRTGQNVAPLPDDSVNTRHDLIHIDLESLHLSPFEISQINRGGTAAQQALMQEVGQLQEKRRTLTTQIGNSEKRVAEFNKAISGIKSIINNSDIVDIDMSQAIDRLTEQRDQVKNSIAGLVDELNAIPDRLRGKRDELNALSKLVK